MPDAIEHLDKARGHLYDAGRALDSITATVRAMTEDHENSVRFYWMLQHPDEAAAAMADAYAEWDGDAELWRDILRSHLDEAMECTP